MSRAIVAALALAILAISGAYGVEAALESAGEDHLVTNETFTPTAGSTTTLDESQRSGAYYSHNVTVYDENGTEMDPGTDYKWFIGDGTVKAVTGGGLDGDASAKITYGYQQTTAQQRSAAALLAKLPQMLGLFLPAVGLVIFLAFLRN